MKLLLFLTLISQISFAETLVSCHDGDTCKFLSGEEVIKVRFSGIDAPEITQPYGPEARLNLINLLRGQNVSIDCGGQHYSRTTCDVYVEGRLIQSELVRGGWALDFPNHSGGKYRLDQEYARRNRLGMWAGKDIYSPFCWRWKDTPQCRSNHLFQK